MHCYMLDQIYFKLHLRIYTFHTFKISQKTHSWHMVLTLIYNLCSNKIQDLYSEVNSKNLWFTLDFECFSTRWSTTLVGQGEDQHKDGETRKRSGTTCGLDCWIGETQDMKIVTGTGTRMTYRCLCLPWRWGGGRWGMASTIAGSGRRFSPSWELLREW